MRGVGITRETSPISIVLVQQAELPSLNRTIITIILSCSSFRRGVLTGYPISGLRKIFKYFSKNVVEITTNYTTSKASISRVQHQALCNTSLRAHAFDPLTTPTSPSNSSENASMVVSTTTAV